MAQRGSPALGLALDMWAYHTQLAGGDDTRARVPGNCRIILNHVGGPIGVGPFAGPARRGLPGVAARDMRALARMRQHHVKLGGLAMQVGGFDFHEAELPPSSAEIAEAWRPYIETCIEAFGAARCMFESNFPVDKGMCGYVEAWNAFKRIASGAGDAERADLFAGTAQRVYRLDTSG